MRDDQRKALEALGPARVKHLLSQAMLVHHLMVPAYEWLTELDEKAKPEEPAKDKTEPGHE